MPSAPTRIGIAVVEHAGRYLVGVRPDGVPLAGYAEFPGGKCEPGEPPEICAIRECVEESGLAVKSVRRIDCLSHTYDHGTVELHFWLCRPLDPTTVTADHRGYRWVAAAELKTLKFPEANAGVIRKLIE